MQTAVVAESPWTQLSSLETKYEEQLEEERPISDLEDQQAMVEDVRRLATRLHRSEEQTLSLLHARVRRRKFFERWKNYMLSEEPAETLLEEHPEFLRDTMRVLGANASQATLPTCALLVSQMRRQFLPDGSWDPEAARAALEQYNEDGTWKIDNVEIVEEVGARSRESPKSTSSSRNDSRSFSEGALWRKMDSMEKTIETLQESAQSTNRELAHVSRQLTQALAQQQRRSSASESDPLLGSDADELESGSCGCVIL